MTHASDPACEICMDTGQVFGHEPSCSDDLCALNGDIHSCNGMVEPCSCPAGSGEAPAAEPAILAIEAAKLESAMIALFDLEVDPVAPSEDPFYAGVTIPSIDFDDIEDDWDDEPMDPEDDYD